MTYRLGVDLGTTFTAAATVGTTAGGPPPTMVGLGNRSLQIPSVLFLTEQQEILVGESAERRGLGQPDRVVREFKRRIGDTVPILVAGAPFSPQALTAHLLQYVVQTTSDRLGQPPNEVVLTHPANWGPYKLELLDQVARLAGVERSSRCPEPLAAAAQYAAQTRVAIGETIAVYDLGGGTFDACVLRKTATGFVQLGTPEGIEHLGGIDFDEALFRYALDMLGDRVVDLDPDDPDATAGLARLRRDCVDAKEALSADTDAMLPVALPGLHTTLRLTRSEFEGLIRPALADSVAALDRAIHSAGLSPDQLSAIVLVGGSSRIPLIGELLHQAFPTPTAMDTHPKHDIALGAVQLDLRDNPDPLPSDSPTVRTPRADAGSPPAPPAEEATVAPAATLTSAGRTQPSGPRVPRTDAGRPPASAVPPQTSSPVPSPAGATPRRSELASPAGRPRRAIIVGAGAVAVIAGIVIGLVVVNRDGTHGGGEPQPSVNFDSSAPSDPPSPPVDDLPRSGRLSATQLLVPVQTGNQWDVWLGDTSNSSPLRRLTSGLGVNASPVIAPTFDSMIYIHADDAESTTSSLRVTGLASSEGDRELFPLPTPCQRAGRPAWNPVEQTQLAIACTDSDGRYLIHLMTTDGKLVSTVEPPAGEPRMGDVAFSSDGKDLIFWAAPDSDSDWDGGRLYTVPTTGGAPELLIKNDHSTAKGRDADPVYSPDGQYVAFRRRVPAAGKPRGQADIFRVRVDGTELTRLTDDPADEQDPSWSPDSSQIAYKSAAATQAWPNSNLSKIWIMTPGRDDERVLWSTGTDDLQTTPAWTPR